MSGYDEEQALAEIERAAAAPYIDYPPTPWWCFPASGLWFGGWFLTATGLFDRPLLAIPGAVVLVALLSAFVGWYQRYRGNMPKLRGAPREVDRVMRWYLVGAVALLVLAFAAHDLVGAWAGALLVTIVVPLGLLLYESRYGEAAEAVRNRLS